MCYRFIIIISIIIIIIIIIIIVIIIMTYSSEGKNRQQLNEFLIILFLGDISRGVVLE